MYRLFGTEEAVEICGARSLMTESWSGSHVDDVVFMLAKVLARMEPEDADARNWGGSVCNG